MRITDLLQPQSVELHVTPADKAAAIHHLTTLMAAGGHLADAAKYEEDVLAREASGSTGLGEGIATPHAKSSGVKTAGLAAMTVPDGVEFESLDGQPARLFFMIAAPEGAADTHIEVLSNLATFLIDPDFKNALLAAPSKEAFLALIDYKENDLFTPAMSGLDVDAMKALAGKDDKAADTAAEAAPANSAQPYRVLAVTACPTGIAHTYMAAESLERTAKDMGITIKVEKNGASGIKDALTADEIAGADCIIIAADKQVAMARFDGKP